jgi:hypothetical protein
MRKIRTELNSTLTLRELGRQRGMEGKKPEREDSDAYTLGYKLGRAVYETQTASEVRTEKSTLR